MEQQKNIIKQFFPNLAVYSKEDLSSMDSQKLIETFQQIENDKRLVNEKVIQLGVQIEDKEKILVETKVKMKDQFGVETLEELEVLKSQAREEFDSLHLQLIELIS